MALIKRVLVRSVGPEAPTAKDNAADEANEKERLDKIKKLNIAFYGELNTLKQTALQADISVEKTSEAVTEDMNRQRVLVEDQTQQKIEAIKNDPKYNGAQRDQLEILERKNRDAQIAAIDSQEYDRKIKALDNEAKYAATTGARIVAQHKKDLVVMNHDQDASDKAKTAGYSTFARSVESATKDMITGQKTFAQATIEIFFGALSSMAQAKGEFALLE